MAVVKAYRADHFVHSLGAVTHNWYDYNRLLPLASELGIYNLRGGNPKDPEYDGDVQRPHTIYANDVQNRIRYAYDKYGIRWTTAIPNHWSARQLYDHVKTVGPQYFSGVEGYNEPIYFTQRENREQYVRDQQADLWNLFKGDSATAHIDVLSYSPVFPADAQQFGYVGDHCDIANIHLYYGGDFVEKDYHQYGTIDWVKTDVAGVVAPNKTLIYTETGYHNGTNVDGHTGTPDLNVEAIYMPRLYLYHYMRGIKRSFKYTFLNHGPEYHADGSRNGEQEDLFGYVKNDWSPKPSYKAVKNLVSLLREPGDTHDPASLDYSLNGDLADVRHMLFHRGDGRFMLAVWLGVQSYNRFEQYRTYPAARNITFNIPSNNATVKVHQLSDTGDMTTNSLTVTNGSFSYAVRDTVAVIEIGTASGSTGGGGTGSGGTSLPAITLPTLYEHGGYDGVSQSLDIGEYNAAQLNIVGDNKVSSLRVPTDYVVRVCTEANGAGICKEYTAGDHTYVGDELNDAISYVKVSKLVSTPPASTLPNRLFINVGSSAENTTKYVPDTAYNDGSGAAHTWTNVTIQATSAQDPHIYRTERYSCRSFNIPLPSDNYAIRLHFCENYSGITAAGQRTFGVNINGAAKLTNFDVFRAARGRHKPISRLFRNVPTVDGKITISFVWGVENPFINGIEIIPESAFTG